MASLKLKQSIRVFKELSHYFLCVEYRMLASIIVIFHRSPFNCSCYVFIQDHRSVAAYSPGGYEEMSSILADQ